MPFPSSADATSRRCVASRLATAAVIVATSAPAGALAGELDVPLSSRNLVQSAEAAGALFQAPVGADYERAKQCLTEAVYYEAASEPLAGQQAVAQVVLNRVRHPAFPKSVCEVVYQGSTRTTGCQFTFTCDGSLARRPIADKWGQAEDVAARALAGFVDNDVISATHYHAKWMVPYWRSSMTETARIGAHIFYEMPGARGATAVPYAGSEPLTPQPLRMVSTAPQQVATAQAPRARPAKVGPATFAVWGLDVATVTPVKKALWVHADK